MERWANETYLVLLSFKGYIIRELIEANEGVAEGCDGILIERETHDGHSRQPGHGLPISHNLQ
jgi:hypothetical protein